MIDGIVPNSSVKTDQRLVKLIVRHLEPSVASGHDYRVVNYVRRIQLTVVW